MNNINQNGNSNALNFDPQAINSSEICSSCGIRCKGAHPKKTPQSVEPTYASQPLSNSNSLEETHNIRYRTVTGTSANSRGSSSTYSSDDSEKIEASPNTRKKTRGNSVPSNSSQLNSMNVDLESGLIPSGTSATNISDPSDPSESIEMDPQVERAIYELMGINLSCKHAKKIAWSIYIGIMAVAAYGGGSQGYDAVKTGLMPENLKKYGLQAPFLNLDDHAPANLKKFSEVLRQVAPYSTFIAASGLHMQAVDQPQVINLPDGSVSSCLNRKNAWIALSLVMAVATSMAGFQQMVTADAPKDHIIATSLINIALYFSAFNKSLPSIITAMKDTFNEVYQGQDRAKNLAKISLALANIIFMGLCLQLESGATAEILKNNFGLNNEVLAQGLAYFFTIGYDIFATKNSYDVCMQIIELLKESPNALQMLWDSRAQTDSTLKNTLLNLWRGGKLVAKSSVAMAAFFLLMWGSKIMNGFWTAQGGESLALNIGDNEAESPLLNVVDYLMAGVVTINTFNAVAELGSNGIHALILLLEHVKAVCVGRSEEQRDIESAPLLADGHNQDDESNILSATSEATAGNYGTFATPQTAGTASANENLTNMNPGQCLWDDFASASVFTWDPMMQEHLEKS